VDTTETGGRLKKADSEGKRDSGVEPEGRKSRTGEKKKTYYVHDKRKTEEKQACMKLRLGILRGGKNSKEGKGANFRKKSSQRVDFRP